MTTSPAVNVRVIQIRVSEAVKVMLVEPVLDEALTAVLVTRSMAVDS